MLRRVQGNQGVGGTFLGVLVFLSVCSYASDVTDKPIGHLRITPGPNDTINVEARCVPTVDLIEQLANSSGTVARFDRPCYTYVTINRPDRYEPPAFWIELAGWLGGRLSSSRKGNVWQLHPVVSGSAYDTSLTENEIYNTYRKTLPGAVATTAGQDISSGVLLYDGVFVQPPYRLTTRPNEKSGNPEVLVNGLVLRTVPVASGEITNIPGLPRNGQFDHYLPLLQYVAYDLYPGVLATTGSPADALAASVDFARSQHIIEAVLDEHAPVVVKFRDIPGATYLFPLNYDFEVAGLSGSFASGLTPEAASARSEELKRDIETTLQRGSVIVHSKFGEVEFGAPDVIAKFLADIELAATLPVHQAECVLTEVIEDQVMSREIAANLAGGVVPLTSALTSAIHVSKTLSAVDSQSMEVDNRNK